MFKKLTFLLIAALALDARAQITIDDDTLYAYGAAGTSSSDFVDIYGHTVIRNLSSGSSTIQWNRMVNNLPDTNWTSAVCDIISCRSPEVSLDSFTFAAGGDTGILSFHFYPKNIPGNGVMKVRFSLSSDPLQFVDVVVIARAWNPVGISEMTKTGISVYPNPAGNTLYLNGPSLSAGTLTLFDARGVCVMRLEYTQGSPIDISSLRSGYYTLTLTNGNRMTTASFIRQ